MDLTGRARDGKLDKVIGRDEETERVIQILNRRQKNNPCLTVLRFQPKAVTSISPAQRA